jgi:hypothetical protein
MGEMTSSLFPRRVGPAGENEAVEFYKVSAFFTASKPPDLTTIKISVIICASYGELLCGTAFAYVFSKGRPGSRVPARITDSNRLTDGPEWKVP